MMTQGWEKLSFNQLFMGNALETQLFSTGPAAAFARTHRLSCLEPAGARAAKNSALISFLRPRRKKLSLLEPPRPRALKDSAFVTVLEAAGARTSKNSSLISFLAAFLNVLRGRSLGREISALLSFLLDTRKTQL
jgi:hypothetical protein